MKRTFACDDSVIITIPIGSLKNSKESQLMPEKFQCVFRDNFKVFVVNGKPKPLGAAQAIAGVFIVTLSLVVPPTFYHPQYLIKICALPSVLFVVTGMLTYTAGQFPNMLMTKLSFSLNIFSFLWSVTAVIVCGISFSSGPPDLKLHEGIRGLIMTLLVVEKLIAVFLIYWLSKAVSRSDFNTLPIILLKHGD